MKVAVVFGTRPETIKLAPVVLELHRITSYNVCYTKLLRRGAPGAERTHYHARRARVAPRNIAHRSDREQIFRHGGSLEARNNFV